MNKPDSQQPPSAEPAKPIVAAKPAEPVKPEIAATPTIAPAKPAEPVKPAVETKPSAAPTKPAEPAKPAIAAKPVEPAKSAVEAKPSAAPTKPAEPAKPAVAAKPVEPAKSAVEAKPSAAPTKPAETAKPVVAAKPVEPVQPVAPIKAVLATLKTADANQKAAAKPSKLKAWACGVGCGVCRSYKKNRLLALVVLLPLLLAVLYFGLLAKDRYVSESIVVVKRADDLAGANLNIGALLGGGSATVREDAMLLQQYILAPDMLKKLDAKLDFKTAFAASGWDVFQRLPKDVSFEDYLDYYRSKIGVGFDEKTSVLTITTQGFTPEFAQQFNQAVLAESELFINELSHKISREEMLFANQEINRAYGQLQGAKETLLTFQNDNNLVDPQVQIEATSRLVAELQAKQAQLEAELTNYLSYLNDDTPQIKAARSAIESIQAQIEKERATLTSSDDEQLNQKMFEFEELKAKVAFEGDLYKLSLTALEKARVEAARKAKSLAVVSQPYLAEDARYPRRLYMLLTVFLVSLLVYGLTKVTLSIIEDHKI